MATPTEDLVLRTLREIQGTLAEHGRHHDEHKRQFQRLQVNPTEVRKSLVTALGLRAHADVRNDLMENRLGALEARIGKLNELDARVKRLEAEEA